VQQCGAGVGRHAHHGAACVPAEPQQQVVPAPLAPLQVKKPTQRANGAPPPMTGPEQRGSIAAHLGGSLMSTRSSSSSAALGTTQCASRILAAVSTRPAGALSSLTLSARPSAPSCCVRCSHSGSNTATRAALGAAAGRNKSSWSPHASRSVRAVERGLGSWCYPHRLSE
jgi:hypothetical protein